MLHRAIFGSLERFFGVLIESTAGDFPVWLAPTQLRLLPVSDEFRPYCEEVQALGKAAGLRIETDPGGRSVGKQIKLANQEKIPLYAVVGEKEIEARTLSLNFRKGDGTGLLDLGVIDVDEAISRLELASKTGTPIQDVFETPKEPA